MPSVLSMPAEVETQIVTIRDVLTTTVTVTPNSDDDLVEQLSDAEDMQTLWMIVALVLLAVVIIMIIAFIIILACTHRKKAKSIDLPKTVKMRVNHSYDGVQLSINEGTLISETSKVNVQFRTLSLASTHSHSLPRSFMIT